MKILVTGATGFIGGYVISELLKYNCEIVATSRNIDKAKKQDWFPYVHYLPYDLNNDIQNSFDWFGKPDLLIHLAWGGLPNYYELFHIERNLLTNCRFIKNIVVNGLSQITILGSCFEYGLQNGCLSESFDAKPVTVYGMAKDFLRKYIVELNKIYPFNYRWVRLFYTYGAGQHQSSILAQLDKAFENHDEVFNMSGGEQLRDYLPVEKAAEYIVKIAAQSSINGVINCCSGRPISIRKLIEDYLEKNNKRIHLNLGYYSYPDYEPMAFWGDNTRLKAALKL
jgi:nucleoside-diphosphate-sugar epimerase